MVYLDEAGIDDNEDYAYGYGPKGSRFYAMKSGKTSERMNMIATLNRGVIKAPCIFKGSTTTELFLEYTKNILVPELKPGQTVIMDNASFHKAKEIEKLINDAGCRLLYLPTYSPDFNPIEHYWHPIKNTTRKNLPLFDYNIETALTATFANMY